MTTQQEHFAMMARHSLWANTKLYDACAALSETARQQDRQVYFTSIHQTLNHILIGDRIWASRFYGTPWTDYALDMELYADFDALRAAQMDEATRLAIGLMPMATPLLPAPSPIKQRPVANIKPPMC